MCKCAGPFWWYERDGRERRGGSSAPLSRFEHNIYSLNLECQERFWFYFRASRVTSPEADGAATSKDDGFLERGFFNSGVQFDSMCGRALRERRCIVRTRLCVGLASVTTLGTGAKIVRTIHWHAPLSVQVARSR